MRRPPDERVRAPDLDVRDGDSAVMPVDAARDDEDLGFTSDSISAHFGSLSRSRSWAVPDQLDVSAIFGEVTLDFREASLPASGVVEVDASAIFSTVRLVVPVGTDVEVEGRFTLFGEIGHSTGWLRLRSFLRRFVMGELEEDEPEFDHEPFLLRVTGSAVFGEVSVKSTR